VQRIILCPKCRVPAKKDDLGEILCPKCGARLCPEAHVVEGRICTRCGWEDPNYSRWREAQKAQAQSSAAKKPGQSPDSKSQYICPRCGIDVAPALGRCPGCGWLYGVRQRVTQQPPTSATPKPTSKPPDTSQILYKPAHPVADQQGVPPRSPLLDEIKEIERREWNLPPLKRFIRPALVSLLVVIVLTGLVIGGIYVTRFVSQSAELGTWPTLPPITPSKTYTLSRIVIPENGGEIRIVSPSSSSGTFEPGSQVTLMAIPKDCYTFDRWEGASEPSETITIAMESDKSVTAYFRLEDTTIPVISEVNVSQITESSAIITWATDEPATSQVEYGKTEAYGTTTPPDEKLTASHNVTLTGLDPETTYHLRVMSKDACHNEATSEADQTFKTSASIPIGLQTGNRAPDFTLQDLSGGEVILSGLRGKVVMVTFWSTQCGPCVSELPHIQEVFDSQAYENLVILAISIDKDTDEVKKFIIERGYTFTILLDSDGAVAADYNIGSIPRNFFIDTEGIIKEVKRGTIQASWQIEKILDSL
jgi:peroxiredoxin/DNA-directed RNA polymerase subunit M/transcription elongation factor TFIIS